VAHVVLVGPGRAGLSMALAMQRSGHTIVGILGRYTASAGAELLGAPVLAWDRPLPPADVVVVAVRDDSIASVAAGLDPPEGVLVMHLSGLTSIEALAPLRSRGCRIASFHPLQSLPNPQAGSEALAGSYGAVTAEAEATFVELEELASSIGVHPFRLADDDKPMYHAAAAAASNYVIAALSVAERLMDGAGVPWPAARPLVDTVVRNAFTMGTRAALTGPIARGDVGTVVAQREAAAAAGIEEAFVALGRITAVLAGTDTVMEEALR